MTEQRTEPTTFDRFHRANVTGLVVRGILAIILGLIFVFAPIVSVGFMALIVVIALAVGLLIDGVGSIMLGNRGRRADAPGWGWTIAGGVIAVILGVLCLIFPFTAAVAGSIVVLWFLVIGLIVRGVVEIASRTLGGWGTFVGVLNIIFGVLLAIVLFLNPAAVLVSLVWVAGVFGIAWGVIALIGAWRINRARKDVTQG